MEPGPWGCCYVHWTIFFTELLGLTQALQDMQPDSEEATKLIEEHDMEDDIEEDEGFADITEDPLVLNLGITKKLAGTAKGPVHWLTSGGNEYGQVLISVMTAQEGAGLDLMAADLGKRYQQAGVDPPVALYVDCGCCTEAGETKLKARFSWWPDIIIRLDIWYFMRRPALGCTTDAHQLYPGFMSASIFEQLI
ncbi:unnamed protein product [Pleuronectes platessa]|uniref:Uncharacterized protein n=1 Tax=Pleuronectes platessa TaxID=8262 RepID=A0A9N7UPG6_PLEPL|nr:unnamed protein product [Pleuronectes platessa]